MSEKINNVCFIAPLIHPDASNDYKAVLNLLSLTATSVENASRGTPSRLVVSCNAAPEDTDRFPGVDFVKVNLPAPPKCDQGRITLEDVMLDKGIKILHALLHCKKFKPEWIFILDADDWVSKTMVKNVFSRASMETDFLFVSSGTLINHQNLTYQKRYGLHRYCGSTFAFKFSLLSHLTSLHRYGEEGPSIHPNELKTNAAILSLILGDHSCRLPFLRNNGLKGRSLTDNPIAWVVDTTENHSNTKSGGRGKPITQALLDQFGLSKLNHLVRSSPATPSDFLQYHVNALKSLAGDLTHTSRLSNASPLLNLFAEDLPEANELARSYIRESPAARLQVK
ncbi:hypothetical protein [Congregibacter litoralis]|nr:hypothetical protein [Congregibacter litoralis]